MRITIVLGLCVSLMIVACRQPEDDLDPIVNDPPIFDLVHPPRMAAMQLESGDASVNAIVYEAQGPGPHPTVVLLHGYPGNEWNLDLAQAIRRAGWNVVFFHYRGGKRWRLYVRARSRRRREGRRNPRQPRVRD